METTLKLLRHAVALHQGRRRAHVHGRPVRICGKGGVAWEQHGQHLQLPVGDVL
jgi:hypothetical protein